MTPTDPAKTDTAQTDTAQTDLTPILQLRQLRGELHLTHDELGQLLRGEASFSPEPGGSSLLRWIYLSLQTLRGAAAGDRQAAQTLLETRMPVSGNVLEGQLTLQAAWRLTVLAGATQACVTLAPLAQHDTERLVSLSALLRPIFWTNISESGTLMSALERLKLSEALTDTARTLLNTEAALVSLRDHSQPGPLETLRRQIVNLSQAGQWTDLLLMGGHAQPLPTAPTWPRLLPALRDEGRALMVGGETVRLPQGLTHDEERDLVAWFSAVWAAQPDLSDAQRSDLRLMLPALHLPRLHEHDHPAHLTPLQDEHLARARLLEVVITAQLNPQACKEMLEHAWEGHEDEDNLTRDWPRQLAALLLQAPESEGAPWRAAVRSAHDALCLSWPPELNLTDQANLRSLRGQPPLGHDELIRIVTGGARLEGQSYDALNAQLQALRDWWLSPHTQRTLEEASTGRWQDTGSAEVSLAYHNLASVVLSRALRVLGTQEGEAARVNAETLSSVHRELIGRPDHESGLPACWPCGMAHPNLMPALDASWTLHGDYGFHLLRSPVHGQGEARTVDHALLGWQRLYRALLPHADLAVIAGMPDWDGLDDQHDWDHLPGFPALSALGGGPLPETEVDAQVLWARLSPLLDEDTLRLPSERGVVGSARHAQFTLVTLLRRAQGDLDRARALLFSATIRSDAASRLLTWSLDALIRPLLMAHAMGAIDLTADQELQGLGEALGLHDDGTPAKR